MARGANTANGGARTGARAGPREAASAALEVMLTDAVVSQGRVRRFLDPVSTREARGRVGAAAGGRATRRGARGRAGEDCGGQLGVGAGEG